MAKISVEYLLISLFNELFFSFAGQKLNNYNFTTFNTIESMYNQGITIEKMITILIILLLVSFGITTQAQDFDVYHRSKDDNVKMSDLYENTLLDEYQILSRNVRMMDMAYSAIVPGYVHFKAKDFATGYSLLGLRLLGYTVFAINYYNMNEKGININDISITDSEYRKNKVMFYSSISLIVSTYLFDWIHGKYRLEKKQEYIRYKYSIKLKMDNLSYNHNTITPVLSLTYNF